MNIKNFSVKIKGEKFISKEILFYSLLTWEPSVAQVTHTYPRRLPALGQFYRETKFVLLNSTHSNKTLKTELRTFPWASWVTKTKLRQIGHGVLELWSDISTNCANS